MELLNRAETINLAETIEERVVDRRKKSCSALTLTCFLASLSVVVLTIQTISRLVNDLTAKDEFWEVMNQVTLRVYEKINKTQDN